MYSNVLDYIIFLCGGVGASQQSKRGPTYLPNLWAKKPTEGRIQVLFNKRGQPYGENKKKLTEFLGTLSRNGKFVPIDIEDWRKVSKERKNELITMVKVIMYYMMFKFTRLF